MTTVSSWFQKPVACPKSALARIDWLREQGIPTPRAYAATSRSIAIRRIFGRDGRELIDLKNPLSRIDAMLAPAMRIQSLPADDLTWPNWDPTPLIEPRLTADSAIACRAETLWRRIRPRLPIGGEQLLHGDYHPGQLLFEPNGKLWVIDWDDMAKGHPAIDRLNLVIYLSSVAETRQPLWAERTDLAPKDEDERAITIALLLRRALKLAERDPDSRRPKLLVGWATELLD